MVYIHGTVFLLLVYGSITENVSHTILYMQTFSTTHGKLISLTIMTIANYVVCVKKLSLLIVINQSLTIAF